ncbi:hypothetical protein SeLEV6574_g03872 [Synchytrium endobioticum]|uniref:Uncharacterized protein n=1 Tax=Synchytrium endobioticum TaxID=286115 RepID=A0A507D1T7_9FUNG|nr:hypothetical protein SeLEV6574_g03872 [Synchytrium endobioticum]
MLLLCLLCHHHVLTAPAPRIRHRDTPDEAERSAHAQEETMVNLLAWAENMIQAQAAFAITAAEMLEVAGIEETDNLPREINEVINEGDLPAIRQVPHRIENQGAAAALPAYHPPTNTRSIITNNNPAGSARSNWHNSGDVHDGASPGGALGSGSANANGQRRG